MSSAGGTCTPAPNNPANGGFWQFLKGELSYFKLSFVGVLSTLLVAYFQNLSAYDDKVAAQAKDDMTAATQTFTEASSALSAAFALQQHLTLDFYTALPGDVYKDDAVLSDQRRTRNL